MREIQIAPRTGSTGLIVALALCALVLAGCGQKGPLQMPPASAATAPVTS